MRWKMVVGMMMMMMMMMLGWIIGKGNTVITNEFQSSLVIGEIKGIVDSWSLEGFIGIGIESVGILVVRWKIRVRERRCRGIEGLWWGVKS